MTRGRILIFSTAYLPLLGGAEVALKEWTDRLPDWEFDVVCARLRPGLPTTERIGAVTVHRCGIGQAMDKYMLWLLGVRRARSIFSTTPPDIVWSLMASYGGFASLVYAWLRPRTKLLLTLQEGDPLEHYVQRTGRFAWLHRRIFRRADAVQAISGFLARWAMDMGCRVEPTVVPNGVDVQAFGSPLQAAERGRLRNAHGFSDRDTVLVTTSRLSLKNGVDDLIRSLAYLPDEYKAFIIGEGEDRDALEGLARSLGVAHRVVFAGRREHADIPALLQASDVFVRPSLSEGLGNSFLEAMAAGIPIVGTPVGGIPDFLTDGETGVFCAVREPASIAAAVLRLQSGGALRRRLVEQARSLVAERYTWDRSAGRIEKILEDLLR